MAATTAAWRAGSASGVRPRGIFTSARTFWLALAPALLFYTALTLYPMAQVIVSGFTDANGFTGDRDFVGLDNFTHMFTDDPALLDALGHTAVYSFFKVAVQTVVAFLIAVLLNKKMRGGNIYRAIFFAPIVISPVAVVFTWSFMFDPTNGSINTLLSDVGLGSLAQDWLGDYDLALYSVILVDMWSGLGFSVVIFLAGMSTIPAEITEAARVDGAGPLRTMWSITLPLLRNTTGLVLVLAINGALRAFDTVYLMTQGGPGDSTELYMTRLFDEGFVRNNFGYASSMALVVILVLIGIAWLQNRLNDEQRAGGRA
ncbi:carbohydrate ABC transporter permease [Streptomyces hoynatensis]|uniref:Sugar ABC transporter permease n=1 Tax=Streptomyces hoynatensis TaxID=1141874 RepID=A0A3A9YTT8_9ACTN|nr:sugar ABC transporter permease [Streptomyces hoynatensis]RKN39492.1 sugar ABC transporter permease [Streptomyces hoynatensis]